MSQARTDHDTDQRPAPGADGAKPVSPQPAEREPGGDTAQVPLESEIVEPDYAESPPGNGAAGPGEAEPAGAGDPGEAGDGVWPAGSQDDRPDDGSGSGTGGPLDGAELSVEALVGDLERVTAERDQYLDATRRVQAEFENYRKQVGKREAEARDRANDGLIQELLPVLDAFDAAVASGVDSVSPMRRTMLDALAKQGLVRIDPAGSDDGAEPFDPSFHEAVVHAEGESGQAGPVVAEVMRAGYAWKGRVVRPAMVSVRG